MELISRLAGNMAEKLLVISVKVVVRLAIPAIGSEATAPATPITFSIIAETYSTP